MNNLKAFEILESFLESDFSAELEKLETIKIYCKSIVEENNMDSSNDWGAGYRQCQLDFAKAILEYLGEVDE